jgi:HD-like signal output (HDOD) protein
MIMKNYVADELSNKVYHLYKALEQAQKIIQVLEEENKELKKIADQILLDPNKDPAVAS